MNWRRILLGIGANCYGQIVTLTLQLVSVPILLHAWGPRVYGLWVLASALPAALVIVDGGITTASAAAIAGAMGRRDRQAAALLFRQALRFVLVAVGTVAFALSVLLVPDWLPGHLVPGLSDVRPVVLVLLLGGLLGLVTTVLDTALRADGHYPTGFAATATIRLVEGTAVLLVAIGGHGMLRAALGGFLFRLGGTVLFAALVRARAPWIAQAPRLREPLGLRPLLKPALAALAVPLGLVISIQGLTGIAGLVLPLATVPAYTASRTLTRVLVQAVGLLTHALMPELAVLAGQGDGMAIAAIRRHNARIGTATLVPAWLVLVLWGPAILRRWTGGSLDIPPVAFALLASAALLHGLWMSGANLLLAVNRQADYSYLFVGVAALSCPIAYALGAWFGLAGIASASFVAEATMAVWVLPHLATRLADLVPSGAAR